jgi:uncharacterized protein YcnI
MIRKLAVVTVVVAGVVMLTAGAAFAHVEIEREGEVSTNGVVSASISVPNEMSSSNTTKIVLVFPASPKLTQATAEDANGFTATVQKNANGDVESITWTGGTISGDDEAQFPITVGDVPSGTDTVEFKALQTYDDGTVVRWIEPTPPGGAEPEHPAPVLYVKGEPPHDEGAADTGTTTAHSDSGSHDDGMSTGAIVAIVIGVIIVIALIVFLVTRSRRGPKTPTA